MSLSAGKLEQKKEKTVSLRQRQTQLGRDAIIESATALFLENGYQKTTIQNIADASGVGPATVFRHFSSKLGVFVAIAHRDIDAVFSAMDEVVQDPPEDVAEAMVELLLAALSFTQKPVSQIPAHQRFWLLFPTGDQELDRFVEWADEKARRLILALLARFQAADQVPKNMDLPCMAEILFQVFNANYIAWNLDHSVELPLIQDKLRRQIPLVFQGWLCG